jgi:rhodanese-related sulfurtransferase
LVKENVLMSTKILIVAGIAAIAVAAGVVAFAIKPWAGSSQLDLNEMIATVHEKFPDVTHIDTAGVKELIAKQPDVQIIDVREPDEFNASHIPGAINVPPETPDDELLAKVKADAPVIVYCSVGWRSSELAERLKAAGRSNVSNYAGSIFAWANAEQPLQSTAGTVKTVHPYDSHWGRYLKPEHRAF